MGLESPTNCRHSREHDEGNPPEQGYRTYPKGSHVDRRYPGHGGRHGRGYDRRARSSANPAWFRGAFRRSEVVGLDVPELDFGKDGLTVTSPAVQDRSARGRPQDRHPVRIESRDVSGSHDPSVARTHWNIRRAAVPLQSADTGRSGWTGLPRRRSTDRKKLALRAGLDAAKYAGHSLRAGHATSAAIAGASERSIMNQTGHRSVQMVRRYIRDGSLFRENAPGSWGCEVRGTIILCAEYTSLRQAHAVAVQNFRASIRDLVVLVDKFRCGLRLRSGSSANKSGSPRLRNGTRRPGTSSNRTWVLLMTFDFQATQSQHQATLGDFIRIELELCSTLMNTALMAESAGHLDHYARAKIAAAKAAEAVRHFIERVQDPRERATISRQLEELDDLISRL